MVAGLDFISQRSNHSDRTLSLGKSSLELVIVPMNSIVCDCNWLLIPIHFFRRTTWVNSKPVPGSLAVPVPAQLVTYSGQMCMPHLHGCNCSCRQESLCCTVCTSRETELWSPLWNPCCQTGRWLRESRPCIIQEPWNRLVCIHRKIQESVTVLNLMWHNVTYMQLP